MKKNVVWIVLLAMMMTSAPALATERGASCKNCPPPRKHYDSREVVKSSRTIDHSRVINTTSVVPVVRHRTTNHLVVRKNETRHVGVVRHNHTIIEKEIRLVPRKRVVVRPAETVIVFVTQKYRVVERPRMVYVDAPRPVRRSYPAPVRVRY